MFLVLKEDFYAIDANTASTSIVPAGRHKIERVENPMGFDAPWLVLEGTGIGMCENAWRQRMDDITTGVTIEE